MSGLEGIKARAKAYTQWGTPGLRAPQDRAALLAILTAVEEAVYSGGHADWCDHYHGATGECRCWKSDITKALEGAV
jgi:hypothetical protein